MLVTGSARLRSRIFRCRCSLPIRVLRSTGLLVRGARFAFRPASQRRIKCAVAVLQVESAATAHFTRATASSGCRSSDLVTRFPGVANPDVFFRESSVGGGRKIRRERHAPPEARFRGLWCGVEQPPGHGADLVEELERFADPFCVDRAGEDEEMQV